MLFDNVNIKSFNAREIGKIDIQPAKSNNKMTWCDNALIPLLEHGNNTYNRITIPLLIQGENKHIAYINCSNLIQKANKCILNLEDRDLKFNAILDSYTTKFNNLGNKINLTLIFKGYCLGNEIIENMNTISEKVIDNKGNEIAPCIIEITPLYTDIIYIKIENLSYDAITIKNLSKGNTVIIDSELGLITENNKNKFQDTDMWEFPRLRVGKNTVKLNRSDCNVTIKYKPRYV